MDRLAPSPIEEAASLIAPDTRAAGDEVEGFAWTQEVCQYPLAEADPVAIAERVLADLRTRHIDLPDAADLARRCVSALLVGHLILQGPPGTGKTTLARALARGFRCGLLESTATSEWSPFHVIGGLRPNPSGGLSPAHGKVAEAVLSCANVVRQAVNAEAGDDKGAATADQAVWLLVDEFNRADIDKAVGSLYTMLSSCDPDHLATAPIDLWFESDPGSRQLWAPARFRIIGTMNDLDTSFVNAISQGLKRRFQFVTVGLPTSRATAEQPVTSEVETAFAGAYTWLDRTYGATVRLEPVAQVRAALASSIEALQRVIDALRYPAAGRGWPIGTAQVVDILRTVLIRHATDPTPGLAGLDLAMADRLVPQLGSIDDDQYEKFRAVFEGAGLAVSVSALNHLLDPHAVL